MRFLAGIRNEDDRQAAETALIKGKSPDTVKIAMRGKTEAEDPVLRLQKEKLRLERTISTLSKRLEEVNRELGKES
jgi:endonuclease V-like protein UPF0215 family